MEGPFYPPGHFITNYSTSVTSTTTSVDTNHFIHACSSLSQQQITASSCSLAAQQNEQLHQTTNTQNEQIADTGVEDPQNAINSLTAHDPNRSNNSKPNIVLYSPVGFESAIYEWPLSNVDEIIDTIKWVARECLAFAPAIDNLLANHEIFNYDDVKNLCDKYNTIINNLNTTASKFTSLAVDTQTSKRASRGLLRHIIHKVYEYAVVEPEKLNQYLPFSSEVYGETSFDFVAQMIDDERMRPGNNDIFIDLGSGVGQVVLQIAAMANCKKCYGIEKADTPAIYAKTLEEKFRFWMNWHGKTFSEFEIFHGDFLENRFSEIIRESTHIFVNNFAFKPEIDFKLKQKFIDLKDGARIISSKQFCPSNRRVTERKLTDIGSIMHVVEILPTKGSVSWTNKCVPYYLHVLDGTKIEKFYEQRLSNANKTTTKRRGAVSVGRSKSAVQKKQDQQPRHQEPQQRQSNLSPSQPHHHHIVRISKDAIKIKIPKTVLVEATRLREEKEARKRLKIEKKYNSLKTAYSNNLLNHNQRTKVIIRKRSLSNDLQISATSMITSHGHSYKREYDLIITTIND